MAADAERRAMRRRLRTHRRNLGTEGVTYVLGPGCVLSRLWHICNPPAAGAGDHSAPRSAAFTMCRKGIVENDSDVGSTPSLVSLPVSELSDDLFAQRGRKRLLPRDRAGLPNRLAHLVGVGAAAGAVGEVSLEPFPLVGR